VSDGSVIGIFGSPGSGKSYFLMNTLIPRQLERGDFVVYSTSKNADADAWKWGPVIRSPREIYGKDLGKTRAVLMHRNRAGAAELVQQARRIFPTVTRAEDEAHELWPSSLDASPDKLQGFHTFRDERGLTLIWASQWPAKFSKTVYRSSTDLGGVYWFRLTTPKDVGWVEDEYEAAAALQVSELAEYQSIYVTGKDLPPGWDGFRERLRRKADRLSR
jgi:hypothetical protein